MPYDPRLINQDSKKLPTLDILLRSEAEALLAGGFSGSPDQPNLESPILKRYKPEKPKEYSQTEQAKAAWERENEIGSYIAKQQSGFEFDNEPEADFDIVDYITNEVNNTDYASYAENFVQFKNRRNAELYKKHLDREFKNSEILQASGWSGVGWGVAASLLSPLNLIPVGGSAYKAYKAGKFAKGAAITAGIGGASVAASESILQATQDTRTAEEGLLNIAGGTILAGVLGGASALLSKKKFDKVAKKVEKDAQNEFSESVKINPETQNLEIKPEAKVAEKLTDYNLYKKQYDDVYVPEQMAKNQDVLPFKDYLNQQTSLVPTLITDVAKLAKIDKLTRKLSIINNLNPIQRLTRTEYAVAPREFAQKLMKTGMFTNKNLEGIANYQSAEISKISLLAPYNHAYRPVENRAYFEFKDRIKKNGATEDEAAITNETQFFEKVSRAARNNDIALTPEVMELAKLGRQNVFNKLGQEAVNVNILSQEKFNNPPKTAPSYFPRLWHKVKVVSKENELRKFLADKVRNVLLPKIKESELQKELTLNSRINDLQTKKAQLQNVLDEASEAKLRKANEGAGTFYTFDELVDYLNRYKTAIKEYNNIKPKSLFQFIQENGGIVDSGGELAAMGFTHKTLPSLIKKGENYQSESLAGIKRPLNWRSSQDNITAMAWENGYFDDFLNMDGARPSVNDLLELMQRELNGQKVYSNFDIEKVQAKEAAGRLIDELDDLGIDFKAIEEAVSTKNGKIVKKIINTTDNKPIDNKTKIKIEKSFAKTEIELIQKRIDTLKAKYEANQAENAQKWGEISNENEYVDGVVSDIVSTLKGEDRLGLIDDSAIKIAKRGPLKERTLSFISDNELEPWLENDYRKVVAYYANTMATDIEIARAFDGDLTLGNAIEEISQEYDAIIAKTPDEKELRKINKEKITAINDLQSVAKIMRGMYARPENPDSMIVRGGRIARQYNYISKMGQVVYASMTDISRPIAKHGLKTWAKTLPNLITNIKGIKLSVKEAKLAGNIHDIVAPERMASFSEIHDPYATRTSAFEKYVDNVSNLMSRVNLMPIWNDWNKGFSAVLSQQRMIKNIMKYDRLKTKDIAYLAQNGIGKEDIPALQDQIKRFSYKEKNLFVANTEKWDNDVMRRKYYNALNTDIDSTIITMGAGDSPLMAHTEVGKVVFQFKSFLFAATQQALMVGLQQKDLAALSGFATAISLGMLQYYLKRKISGKEVSEDPMVWLSEGINRSGFTGVLGEYSAILDKVGLGFNSAIGIEESSKYATRNSSASLLGPSISLINDGFTTTKALTSGEIDPASARAIRRMIIFNNHWLLTGAMDKFQQNIINTAQ